MKKILFLVLLLTGCATEPTPSIYDIAQQECRAYGFSQGTEGFAACYQREVIAKRDIILRAYFAR